MNGPAPGGAEWRRGWPLVLAAALGISVQTYFISSMGVVAKPLSEAFGWSRGQISSATALTSTVLVLMSPLTGFAVDRIGARRIAIPGLVLYCAGMACVSLVGPSIWSWYGAFAFLAVVGVAVSSTIWTAAVASRFEATRGLALGATLSGHGFTSLLAPIVAAATLQALGWRAVYLVLAALGAATAIPAVLLFFRDARDIEAGSGRRRVAEPSDLVLPGYGLAEAIRQTRYWRLAVAMLIGGAAVGALQLHLTLMMTDAGMSLTTAAATFALLGPATIVGRLAGGFLMDRIFAPLVAAGIFALPAIDCALILAGGIHPWNAALIVILAGLALGAEVDTMSVLIARYFGLRAYGRIYAPVTALFALGFGYAGMTAGYVHDLTGSYGPLLLVLGSSLLVSILLLLTLGPFPDLPDGSVATGAVSAS